MRGSGWLVFISWIHSVSLLWETFEGGVLLIKRWADCIITVCVLVIKAKHMFWSLRPLNSHQSYINGTFLFMSCNCL